MSSSLPPEILDHIVDHLHDEPTTLRECCLVSKSWISRTRIHLFHHVEFRLSGRKSLESWMETFPDPSNSPAHYTRSLRIVRLKVIAVAISDARPWALSFHRVVDMHVITIGVNDRHLSSTQLHGLFPTLKSLRIPYSPPLPLPEVLDFVCSFPLLEDLSLCSASLRNEENDDEWNAPPTSPKFTGSLLLSGSNRGITRKLLGLPGGLHFSKIRVRSPIGEGDLTKELVSTCSDTLESLCVGVYHGASPTGLWTINT
jgi:hypothetical protein